jgi:hypothetical protein
MAEESDNSTLTALGAIGGGLLGAVVANGLGVAFGPDFVIGVFAGGAVGGLCGLIPYFAADEGSRICPKSCLDLYRFRDGAWTDSGPPSRNSEWGAGPPAVS